jgi:hypothetical protein
MGKVESQLVLVRQRSCSGPEVSRAASDDVCMVVFLVGSLVTTLLLLGLLYKFCCLAQLRNE